MNPKIVFCIDLKRNDRNRQNGFIQGVLDDQHTLFAEMIEQPGTEEHMKAVHDAVEAEGLDSPVWDCNLGSSWITSQAYEPTLDNLYEMLKVLKKK